MYDPGMTAEAADQAPRQRGVVLAGGTSWVLVYLPGTEQHPCPPDTAEAYRVLGPDQLVGHRRQRLAEADPSWLIWTWALIARTGWGHLGNSAVAREWETAALVARGDVQPFRSLSAYRIAGRFSRAHDEQERSYWREQYSRATGRRGTDLTRELHAYDLIHRQSESRSTDTINR